MTYPKKLSTPGCTKVYYPGVFTFSMHHISRLLTRNRALIKVNRDIEKISLWHPRLINLIVPIIPISPISPILFIFDFSLFTFFRIFAKI